MQNNHIVREEWNSAVVKTNHRSVFIQFIICIHGRFCCYLLFETFSEGCLIKMTSSSVLRCDLLRWNSLSSLSSGDSWTGVAWSPFMSGRDSFPGRVWYLFISMCRFCKWGEPWLQASHESTQNSIKWHLLTFDFSWTATIVHYRTLESDWYFFLSWQYHCKFNWIAIGVTSVQETTDKRLVS